jgi:hypothetical protein
MPLLYVSGWFEQKVEYSMWSEEVLRWSSITTCKKYVRLCLGWPCFREHVPQTKSTFYIVFHCVIKMY